MLIIGSVAAKYHIPNFRTPKDLDVWMTSEQFQVWHDKNQKKIISIKPQKNINKFFINFNNELTIELRLLTKDGPHMKMYEAQTHDDNLNIAGGDFKVASLLTLIKLKRSHLEFPLRWEKHIVDYNNLLSNYNNNVSKNLLDQNITLLNEAYSDLYKATAATWKIKTANLNMSNEDFFGKSEALVRRHYQHDSIHKAIMFYDQPMFEKMKVDLNKATCSKKLWNEFSFEDKIKSVQEEAMVIALERKIIPAQLSGEIFNADDAIRWSTRRIATNLTSGWFRDFALDNYLQCINLPFDYVIKFNNNIRQYE